MALDVKVTTLSWLTDVAGTTYDVTLGFQPKIVLVCGVGTVSAVNDVARGNISMRFGIGTSSSSRYSMVFRSNDAATTALLGIRHSSTSISRAIDTNGASFGILDIDAEANWPGNGIRFIVDEQFTGTTDLMIVGIGGSDITAQTTGAFQEPGATGNQTIAHGLGTTPTGALFFSVGLATAPDSNSGTQGMYSLGMFDGTNSCVVYGGGDDANTTMDNVSYAKAGELIALGPEPAVTLNGRATGVSFDATNITINWSERASTRYIFYAVWAGGQFTVSSTTTATNTTPFNGPSAGFLSTLALFASANRAASTADTPTAHMQLSLGAATSASERHAQAALDEDNIGTSEVTRAIHYDAVYANIDASSAIQGLMDIDDMSVDPMQLVMDDADPSGSFVAVAMWGATPVAPGVGRTSRLAHLGVS